jgi:sugar-specific transcriptional regulator TrmB
MIRRRPCTARDVADGLNIPMPEVTKILGILLHKNAVVEERVADKAFYKATETS